MTDRILALVDGSPYAESVCRHAAWAASRLGAGVDLLHVLGRRETPTGDLSGALGLGARTVLLGELSTLDAERARLAQARCSTAPAPWSRRRARRPSRSACARATCSTRWPRSSPTPAPS